MIRTVSHAASESAVLIEIMQLNWLKKEVNVPYKFIQHGKDMH